MTRARRAPARVLAVLLLATAVAPLATSQGEPLVSQSLWGVKNSVGIGVGQELVTNYGDRAFWEARPTGQGVRVAVIDTGIDPTHPDLQDVLACERGCWRDLVNQRSQPYDDHGHGTHVAGIIAGGGHWQINPLASYFPTGARGIAPGAELLVAKAMNASGSGKDPTVAEAVRWAMDPDGDPSTQDGAHIIHLSLGIETPTQEGLPGLTPVDAGSETAEAVREAISQGTFVVMSAGNQGNQGPAPPGGVDGVISVGALDGSGGLLSFSNRGEGVDLYAPGVITSTWPSLRDDDGIQDGYTGLAGTSQAAPVVSGALALALEAHPALQDGGGATKVAHIERVLAETARPVETADGPLAVLDAGAFLATQDQGTDGVAWLVVTGVLVVVLLVVAAMLRIGYKLLARHAQRRGEKQAQAAAERQPAPPPPDGAPSTQPRTFQALPRHGAASSPAEQAGSGAEQGTDREDRPTEEEEQGEREEWEER